VDHRIVDTGTEPMMLVAAFTVSRVEVKSPDQTAIALPWPT
jgi:hypothetical protein